VRTRGTGIKAAGIAFSKARISEDVRKGTQGIRGLGRILHMREEKTERALAGSGGQGHVADRRCANVRDKMDERRIFSAGESWGSWRTGAAAGPEGHYIAMQ